MGRTPEGPWWRTSRKAYYATIQGRQVRLGTTLEDARTRFRELTEGPPEAATVKHLVTAFLTDRKRQVEPGTYRSYAIQLASFTALAGDSPCGDSLKE